MDNEKLIIVNSALRMYEDIAGEFLSYDELMDLRAKILGIKSWIKTKCEGVVDIPRPKPLR